MAAVKKSFPFAIVLALTAAGIGLGTTGFAAYVDISDTSAVASCDAGEEIAGAAAAPGKPCKPCKGREWCTCTYNGQPRVSCDPCCYQTYTGTICLD